MASWERQFAVLLLLLVVSAGIVDGTYYLFLPVEGLVTNNTDVDPFSPSFATSLSLTKPSTECNVE